MRISTRNGAVNMTEEHEDIGMKIREWLEGVLK